MPKFKPMLACQEQPDVSTLRYPLYATPKLDGFRALVINGKLVGRKLEPIPNIFTTSRFSLKSLTGLDGELVLGPPTAKDVFSATSSALRREAEEPDVKFYCFDLFDSKLPYAKRISDVQTRCAGEKHLELVPSMLILSVAELREREQQMVDLGYEGLILRAPDGPYKFGRSTMKEEWMLKLKRFKDAEATCVDFYEEERNENEATRDKLGRTKRGSSQAGKVGKGRLGGLVLQDDVNFPGVTFRCGTGPALNDKTRAELWAVKEKLPGTVWNYKFQEAGTKDRPRIPTLKGRRDAWDLS